MTTFDIVKYKGHSNALTQFGKTYLALPDHTDPKRSIIYCETGKRMGFNYKSGICSERNKDLEKTGELELDYILEDNNNLTINF
jgi:hypothetical protein